MELKTILFDFDGTLQDSETIAIEASSHGFRTVMGREAEEPELAAWVGKPLAKMLPQWYPEHAEQMLAEIVAYYLTQTHRIICYEGVKELLQGLQLTGFRMGIVSSKTKGNVISELGAHGIASYFEVIVGQEDTSVHKPNPEPLLLAAQLLNSEPEACAYIGDQLSDIQAANRAGMQSIAALWGEGNRERLAVARPSLIVETTDELLRHCTAMSRQKEIG